jgi:hypothetical protein
MMCNKNLIYFGFLVFLLIQFFACAVDWEEIDDVSLDKVLITDYTSRSAGSFTYSVRVLNATTCFGGNGTYNSACVGPMFAAGLANVVCFNSTCEAFTYPSPTQLSADLFSGTVVVSDTTCLGEGNSTAFRCAQFFNGTYPNGFTFYQDSQYIYRILSIVYVPLIPPSPPVVPPPIAPPTPSNVAISTTIPIATSVSVIVCVICCCCLVCVALVPLILCVFCLLFAVIFCIILAIIMLIVGILLRVLVYSKRKPKDQDEVDEPDQAGWGEEGEEMVGEPAANSEPSSSDNSD